jgi:hypothetical protein
MPVVLAHRCFFHHSSVPTNRFGIQPGPRIRAPMQKEQNVVDAPEKEGYGSLGKEGRKEVMRETEVLDCLKAYAEAHCPFEIACDDLLEFELTKAAPETHLPERCEKWYVHVWVPRLQKAYGLFVVAWQDESINVGGMLDPDGLQEIFEYTPSQVLPDIRRFPHPFLE